MGESLIRNTSAFLFPKEAKIFYFSKTDRRDRSLTKLPPRLFLNNIREIFPDIDNNIHYTPHFSGDDIYSNIRKDNL